MKRYIVTVERTVLQFMDFTVEGETEDEARAEALAEAATCSVGWDDCDGTDDEYQTTEMQEIEPFFPVESAG